MAGAVALDAGAPGLVVVVVAVAVCGAIVAAREALADADDALEVVAATGVASWRQFQSPSMMPVESEAPSASTCRRVKPVGGASDSRPPQSSHIDAPKRNAYYTAPAAAETQDFILLCGMHLRAFLEDTCQVRGTV